MAETLAVPFTVLPSGAVATVTVGSDRDLAQLLAGSILTRPGERALHPQLGCKDPRFGRVTATEIQQTCARYGPNVKVTGVTSTPRMDQQGLTDVTVDWTRR